MEKKHKISFSFTGNGLRRLKCLTIKEFKQMIRNIILPVVFIILPIIMMNMVPRVATQEVKNLKFSVIDNDHSQLSQRLIDKLDASNYFTLNDAETSYDAAEKSLKKGDSDFIIEIQPNFEDDLIKNNVANVMVSCNATNGVKAGLGQSYIIQIIADFSAQLRDEMGMNASNVHVADFDISSRFLYNTKLDYKMFMIPALIAMLLVLLIGFLPALNIVGEKEKGTIEQINVTPVGRFEFILSKMIPYWCVGLFILFFAIFLGWKIHGIAPAGSLLLILGLTTLYILVVSCLGLIVSNYSDTTQQASLVMFFFLVIFILLSGLLTPVASMPSWAKAITEINPMRYYIEPMRMIYIKGSSFSELIPYFRTLGIMTVVTWTWAIISYKKSN